ncbi:MAG: hypothetical protein ACOX4B_09585 [Bacillota bacterium]
MYGGVNELMAVNRRLSMRKVKEVLRLRLSLGLVVNGHLKMHIFGHEKCTGS